MIEVRHLSKIYGDHAAVNDLSFTVENGKVVGFLGPNGAGKSTTMNMITGYIAPTMGQVLIDGVSVQEDPLEARKNIGYLPEIPPLYLDMRVREYLRFVAELKGVKKKEINEQIDSIMAKARIVDVSERLIRHLSKGYRQRVGVASAMIGNPDMIILDEPTVGLDPGQIIEMRELIRELSHDHTVLLSSHIMQEISAVCDEIIIINEGKLVTVDTPENITKKIRDKNNLSITAKSDKEVVRTVLTKIEGITNVRFKKDNEPGTISFLVYTESGMDIREDLFYKFAEARIPIIEMKMNTATLEEAFLKLTGQGSRQFGGRTVKNKKKEKEESRS
ncbi:MAG: ATP-binding cassette domain-containing protein [Lachnospiraceae bacterium]|jgi:ABC-2 type transport system ATP-binding protein|nr:ATP-binding cassette domain-containing protein [Lachnospiraceae bacterium]MEE3461913.1 ATP-binding cassette domain-containing protein [Lachnospiraceae bacterium]